MATHPILRMGDPRLYQVAVPVSEFSTPALAALVEDLFESMRAAGGCGLAAPQIGVSLRVVVFGLSKPREHCAPIPDTVLINPQIIPRGEATSVDWEACLSVPGLRGRVRRPDRIHYRAYDLDGRLTEREVSGFHARVIQHECDHLDGILYPSRIDDWQSFGFVDTLESAAQAESAASATVDGRS